MFACFSWNQSYCISVLWFRFRFRFLYLPLCNTHRNLLWQLHLCASISFFTKNINTNNTQKQHRARKIMNKYKVQNSSVVQSHCQCLSKSLGAGGRGEARLIEQPGSWGEEAESVACCGGLQQPHPSPRGEQGEEAVARVGGVGHDLSRPPQCPGVVQGL